MAAIVSGVVALAATQATAATSAHALNRGAASALGLGLGVLVLELAGSHHAPAGSTAVLVAGGLAGPFWPLVGLAIGLTAMPGLAALHGMLPSRLQAARVDRRLHRGRLVGPTIGTTINTSGAEEFAQA